MLLNLSKPQFPYLFNRNSITYLIKLFEDKSDMLRARYSAWPTISISVTLASITIKIINFVPPISMLLHTLLTYNNLKYFLKARLIPIFYKKP